MSVLAVRGIALPSGETIPVLGQGTSGLAEGRHPAQDEIAALRLGLDLGMTLIDTAETYADGGAEELVGRAIEGRRDEVFLVTKVLPDHAGRQDAVDACRASLERLRTDRVDLYLLHWRGPVPLQQTVEAFEELRRDGLVRHWGVSNFGLPDMAELLRVPGGANVETDQVLYNLLDRGIEWDLLPWCVQTGLPLMAYSPFARGDLVGHPVLRGIAVRHRTTSAQVALAWVLSHPGVVAVPRAATPEHVRANRGALDLELHEDDLLELDAAFEPPSRPRALEPS